MRYWMTFSDQINRNYKVICISKISIDNLIELNPCYFIIFIHPCMFRVIKGAQLRCNYFTMYLSIETLGELY